MTETDKDNHHTKKRNAAASGLSAFLPQFFRNFFAIFLPQYFCRNIFAAIFLLLSTGYGALNLKIKTNCCNVVDKWENVVYNEEAVS